MEVARAWLRAVMGGLCFGVSALGAASLACGGAEAGGGLPLTIAECQELGGAPLFDPEDEKPPAESCPDGLYFVGEFHEPFFGDEGGICCGGLEAASPPADEP